MNSLFIRTGVLLVHAILNFIIVSYLLNFDITGKWLRVIVFFVLVFALAVFFIWHLISFINFIKTKTK